MSKQLTERRARILRLRVVEHRVATARLAHADGALANLGRIAGRLAALRRTLGAEVGEASGVSLRAMAEMSQRLDNASDSLIVPISDAERARNRVNAERLKAQQKEDSATKLHDRAAEAEVRARELRAGANRPYRKRAATLGDTT